MFIQTLDTRIDTITLQEQRASEGWISDLKQITGANPRARALRGACK